MVSKRHRTKNGKSSDSRDWTARKESERIASWGVAHPWARGAGCGATAQVSNEPQPSWWDRRPFWLRMTIIVSAAVTFVLMWRSFRRCYVAPWSMEATLLKAITDTGTAFAGRVSWVLAPYSWSFCCVRTSLPIEMGLRIRNGRELPFASDRSARMLPNSARRISMEQLVRRGRK